MTTINNKVIDFSKLSNYTKEFERTESLCSLFKLLAIETWKRLEFIYIKPYIRLFETTVTQNIAFTIEQLRVKHNLPIKIYESTNEKANGNDLELIINFPSYGISFYAPVQAKKIFRNQKYTNIRHDGQIEKLIKYAEDNMGYPLFLFYNYTNEIYPHSKTEPELFGCSVLDAYTVRNNFCKESILHSVSKFTWNKIPSFNDMAKIGAFPWHHLVCDNEPIKLFKKLFPDKTKALLKKRDLTMIDIFDIAPGFFKDLQGVIDSNEISFKGWLLSTSKDRIINTPYLFPNS